jgi:hypothetical protein
MEHVQPLRTPRQSKESEARLRGVYLIPMTDLPIRVRGAFRVDPPKNCQVKFIRYAATYEIGRVKVHAPDSVSN